MDTESKEEIRKRAEERRRKILEKGNKRLEKIHGVEEREIINTQTHNPVTEISPEANTQERERHNDAVKNREPIPATAPSKLLEKITAMMNSVRRIQIILATILGCFYVMESASDKLNPFTLLFLTQSVLVSSTWSYFLLYPQQLEEQIAKLKMEVKFKRLSGQDWKPIFLYWIPGLSPLLYSIDYLRICSRGLTETVSILIVSIVLSRAVVSICS